MELKIGLVSCTNQVAVESHYSAWPPLSCGRDNLLKTFYIKRDQVNCPHILFHFQRVGAALIFVVLSQYWSKTLVGWRGMIGADIWFTQSWIICWFSPTAFRVCVAVVISDLSAFAPLALLYWPLRSLRHCGVYIFPLPNAALPWSLYNYAGN